MCELTAYYKNACAENGGVDEFIVYEIEDRDSYTVAGGAVTALTMKTGKKAVRWTPDMESATAGETTTRSRENNSVMNAQTAMIMFKDDDLETVNTISNASKGFLGVIVKKSDPDDAVYRHYGLVYGMTLETAEGVMGQLFEDLRGHTLNFVGKELVKAPTIDSSIVTTLLTPPS